MDPRVHALIEKITVHRDPVLEELGKLYPYATRVEIWTKQHKKYSHTVEVAKGNYQNPLTDQELQDKFRLCTSKFLSEGQIREIIDAVYHLEKIDKINELMKILVI